MSRVHRARSGITRQAILDACIAELSENGYSSTSMDAIATRARISKMSVYYHYKSKDTLCAEALTAKMNGLGQELRASLSEFENISEALQGSVELIWCHFVIMGRSIFTLLDELRRVNPKLLIEVEYEINEYVKITRNLVRDGQESGEIVDGNPHLLNRLFVNAIGSTIHWYDPENSTPPAEFVRFLQATLPRLLLKSQDGKRKAR